MNGRWSGGVLMIVALTVSMLDAADSVDPRRAAVTVRIFDQIGVSSGELDHAMSEAVRILRTVDLELIWTSCSRRNDESPGCRRVPWPGEFIVRLGAAPSVTPQRSVAMGYALVGREGTAASFATVYEDLVRLVARRAGVDQRRLLGRAIAHEIGHLLLNDNQHANTGLMRAGWSQAELRLNKLSDWTFGEDEGWRIKAALSGRVTDLR
jgi:hypothetical protein